MGCTCKFSLARWHLHLFNHFYVQDNHRQTKTHWCSIKPYCHLVLETSKSFNNSLRGTHWLQATLVAVLCVRRFSGSFYPSAIQTIDLTKSTDKRNRSRCFEVFLFFFHKSTPSRKFDRFNLSPSTSINKIILLSNFNKPDEIQSIPHSIHGAGIYANIGGIFMVNVTIYSIHGSYGHVLKGKLGRQPGSLAFLWGTSQVPVGQLASWVGNRLEDGWKMLDFGRTSYMYYHLVI